MEKNYNESAPAYSPAPPNIYTRTDSAFGAAAFLTGYAFFNWILFGGAGLGGALFVVFVCAFGLMYLRKKGIKLTAASYTYLALILALGSTYFLYSNYFLKFLTTLLLMALYCYWFYVACGNRQSGKITDMFFFDMLKSTVVMPFSGFGAAFSAFKTNSSENGKKRGRTLLFVLIGIIIAIMPTIVIISMLSSADLAFSNLISKISFDFIKEPFEIIRHPLFLMLGIPVSLFIFGLMYTNTEHKNEQSLTEQGNRNFLKAMRFLPQALIYAAITPICIVYILFFASQSAYFLSAFASLIPDGITYAEYARRGFFELCGVAVFNAVAIWLMALLTRRTDEKNPAAVKVYTILLSVFTLALIAIALSKMAMYISVYGLTLSRVYASWFIVLLAFFFILIFLKQLVPKIKLMRTAVVGFLILFLGLAFCDVDAQIAKYNVNSYLNGTLEEVDIDMMYSLSDSAVPYVLQLKDDENWLVEFNAQSYLQSRANALDNWKLRETNLTVIRAAQLLDEAGFVPSEDTSDTQ